MLLSTLRPTTKQVISLAQPLVAQRDMATLADLKLRIRSVTNIRKITATMKLVATSKLKVAQKNMEIARPFLSAVNCIPEVQAAAQAIKSDSSPSTTSIRVIPITSDRGLCGSVNGSILRMTRSIIRQHNREVPFVFSVIGSKGRVGLQREFSKFFDTTASDLGEKKGIRYSDLAPFTEAVANGQSDRISLVANKFVNLVAFETEVVPLLSPSAISALDLDQYEFESEDRETTIQNYFEWYLSATIFGRVIENAACEMSARMGSMDNATRNAGEIIKVLRVKYNRGRQAAITSELAEIIGGAEALKSEESDDKSYEVKAFKSQEETDREVKKFWAEVEAEKAAEQRIQQ